VPFVFLQTGSHESRSQQRAEGAVKELEVNSLARAEAKEQKYQKLLGKSPSCSSQKIRILSFGSFIFTYVDLLA